MKHFFILATAFFFISSCSDPCKDIECLNQGVCEEGICDCPTGYQGIRCESEIRSFLIGDWSTTFTCSNEPGIGEEITTISEDQNNILGVQWEVLDAILFGTTDADKNINFPLDTIYPNDDILEVSAIGSEFQDGFRIIMNILDLNTNEEYVCTFDLTE